MRRAAKKDRNQDDVCNALVACALSVRKLHHVGDGFPDLAIGGYRLDTCKLATLLVELKAPGQEKRITEAEIKFAKEWQGTYMLTSHAEDVLIWFGRMVGEYSEECIIHE